MKKLLLISLIGLTTSAFAQSQRTDSLFALLKKHPQSDTFRVNRLIDLTNEWGLPIARYDSIAHQALLLAQKLEYKAGEAQALFTAGTILYATNRNNPTKQVEAKKGQAMLDKAILLAQQSNNKRLTVRLLTQLAASKRMSGMEKKQALTYDRRALVIAQTLQDDKLISQCQTMIAQDYELVAENYAAAFFWNMQALQTARQAGCRECELFPLRSMGKNYLLLRDYKAALTYLQKALTLNKQLWGKSNNEFHYYILSAMGNLYRLLGQYSLALRTFEQALAVRKRDYPMTTNTIFDNQLAAIYQAQGRYGLAIAHGIRGLAKAHNDQNNWWETDIATTLSLAYLHTGKLDSARYYGGHSLKLAQATHKKEYIRDAYQTLAKVYAAQKEFDRAYQYQGLYYTYRDSLNNEDITRKATASRFLNQISQQQSQIKLLINQKQLHLQIAQQQRIQRNVTIVAAVLLLLLAAATAAWLLNRSRLRRLQDAQTLRKQIAYDLHDEMGSTLSSISLLSGVVTRLIAQKRPEAVERAIEKINTDARQILESLDEIIWTINPGNDSLQRIALRLQEYAQPLMESKDIRFSFQVDPALADVPISMEVRRSLYLIGKEAINNLVKHSQATQATVQLTLKATMLVVLIEDNGRGFDPARLSNRTGQASMKQRAEAMGGSLDVQSAPEWGTRLVLTTAITG
ncbi:hypothetical protein GCM10028805_58020 [Spirosoma harenae]